MRSPRHICSRSISWLAAVSVVIAIAGCSESSLTGRTEDAAVAPPVELVVAPGFYQAEGQPLELITDGDPVPVRFASQGGYAMFIGARVTGLDPGLMNLQAELVNPETSEVFVTDTRTVQCIAALDGSDAVEPDARSASQFAHLLPCPNYGTRQVHGLEWLLRVTATDPNDERSFGSATVRVVPTCTAGSRYEVCVCECEPSYYFSKCGAPH